MNKLVMLFLNFINLGFANLINDGTLGMLTDRLASQIYEDQDLGFNRDEIIELLDTHKKIIEYALDHRDEIEPT